MTRLVVPLVAAVAAWMLLTSYPRGSRMRSVGMALLAFAGTVALNSVIPW